MCNNDHLDIDYYDKVTENVMGWVHEDYKRDGPYESLFDRALKITVEWMMYNPTHARAYIKLPEDIENTKCVLNIQNPLLIVCMQ